jgi:hypothetical protein
MGSPGIIHSLNRTNSVKGGSSWCQAPPTISLMGRQKIGLNTEFPVADVARGSKTEVGGG